MNPAHQNNDSLFSSLVDLAEESFVDIASAMGDSVKEVANLSNAFSEPMTDAEHFANAVDDSEKYPPKDAVMSEMVEDRQISERIEANLRKADGGSAELSAAEKEQQMEDRMESYLAAQRQFTM